MRELSIEETKSSHGGVIVTTAVVTGVVGIATGAIWLTNSLINLYLYKSAGQQPQRLPDVGPTIGQNLKNIAEASKLLK
ncbi:MAG: hypothetical protein U1E78_06215 [Gammaproteobacteria bacterium]